MRLVEGFQALSLCEQFLRGWDDDDHIGLWVGMMILVGNVIDILRSGCNRREVRGRGSIIVGKGDIV